MPTLSNSVRCATCWKIVPLERYALGTSNLFNMTPALKAIFPNIQQKLIGFCSTACKQGRFMHNNGPCGRATDPLPERAPVRPVNGMSIGYDYTILPGGRAVWATVMPSRGVSAEERVPLAATMSHEQIMGAAESLENYDDDYNDEEGD